MEFEPAWNSQDMARYTKLNFRSDIEDVAVGYRCSPDGDADMEPGRWQD